MDEKASRKSVLKLIVRAVEHLLRSENCCPFSKEAKSLLRKKIRQYIVKLIRISVRLAEIDQVQGVSAIHVKTAENYLMKIAKGRFLRHTGTIGGTFLGASISTFLTMIIQDTYSALVVLVSAVLSIIGTFLIAFHRGLDP